MKWAALASGSGTILDAMYARGLVPDLLVVDRECPAFDKGWSQEIETLLLDREGSFRNGQCDELRKEYTRKVAADLLRYDIKLVVMAGWMTVFSPEIFDFFPFQILNIHPSLLPLFKGEHAVRDALAAGVESTGTTVHIATSELDNGPILGQKVVRVYPRDTEEELHERIKVQERILYAHIVGQILTGSIDLDKEWRQWKSKQAN